MVWLRRFLNFLTIISGYLISRLTHKVIHWGSPMAVSIEPTNLCNLSCKECPSGGGELSRPSGTMTAPIFRSVIDQLSPQLTYLTYYFQGEPFLNPEFFVTIRYARSKKIFVSTSTNGHFFASSNIVQIIESGLNRLIISLDGTDQESYASYRVGGSFDKVIDGIGHLTEMKKQMKSPSPVLVIQFLVLKTNQHQIRDIKKLGKQLGVDKVEIKTAQFHDFQKGNPLMPDDPKYSRYVLNRSTDLQLDDPPAQYRIKSHRPNSCFRMWSGCVFTWDGKVVPCCFDKDAKYEMGDMEKNSFQEIWKSKNYHDFRVRILKNRKSIDICNNCTQTF